MYSTIIIVLYFAVLAYLSYLAYRGTNSSTDYLLAGKETHPVIMALSYGSTFISTSAIVGFGGVAAQLGMGILWLVALNIFVGIFIAFAFFGKRTRQIGHNLSAYTFAELIGARYHSKFLQSFIALIVFIFMPIYAAAVLKGGVEFVKTYFNISYDLGLIILVVIVAVYVLIGGLKGVIYTDAFQALIMIGGMTYLLILIYSKLGGIVPAHQQLTDLFNNPAVQEQTAGIMKGGFRGWTSMPKTLSPIWWSMVSSIIAGVGIGVLAQPQLAVRFMTVKSDKELNRGLVTGSIFILIMTGAAYLLGSLSNILFFQDTGKIAVAAGVDSVIPRFISTYVGSWFGPIFMLALLSAAMSTLSAQYHTMGSAFGRDLLEKGMNKKGNLLMMTKSGIIITIIISTILAWLANKTDVSVGIIAAGTSLFMGLCAAAFLPAYVGALYFKSMPKAAAVWSVVVGFTCSAFWMLFIHAKNATNLAICKILTGKAFLVAGTPIEKWSQVDAMFIALPLSIITCVVIWMGYRIANKKDIEEAHIEKCFQGMN